MLSCDDGNLQIETLNFDNATLQNCGTVGISQNNILFKLNTNEALIMDLAANVLKNEEGSFDVDITESTPTKIIYRIFSDTATKNYFCDAVPPVSPTVVEEIIASQATINITTENTGTVDAPIYEHTIKIITITLQTSEGQRITKLTVENFGTIITS